MIEPTAGLPPHIAMLLNESFELDRPIKVRKKLKGLFSDLADQLEIATPEIMTDLGDDPRIFRVVLSGGLDLFSGRGSCQELNCRIQYAGQVSRSIALMADEVTVHDYFASYIRQVGRRPTNRQIDQFLPDLYVLKRLEPLIEAGILRFVGTGMPTCSGCKEEFERRVESVTDIVLEQFGSEMSVERVVEYTAVDTGAMYDPPLVIRANPEYTHDASDSDLIRKVAVDNVRSALWDARDASMVSGTVFSNSKFGLNALLSKEGRGMTSNAFRAFEGQRAAQLPWVDGLTIRQTIALREQAGLALPALRELLARRLSARPMNGEPENLDDCIAELREQAAEVRSSLLIAANKSPAVGKNAKGVLGLGISLLSFAVEGPVQALSNLLETLGLIHDAPSPDSVHVATLKSKPGYVLVAAQDILSHAKRS